MKHIFHLFGTEAILGAYSKRLNFIIKDAPVAPISQEIPRFWKLRNQETMGKEHIYIFYYKS